MVVVGVNRIDEWIVRGVRDRRVVKGVVVVDVGWFVGEWEEWSVKEIEVGVVDEVREEVEEEGDDEERDVDWM